MPYQPHESETKEEYIKRVASTGGKALVKKIGKKGMGKLSKKGLKKRWGKKNKLKDLLFD